MIIAVVNFKIPFPMTLDEARERFHDSAAFFQEAPGLIRKYYLFKEEGVGGGVYVWDSKEAAEKMYDDRFNETIKEKYGNVPTVEYFDVPLLVDNLSGEIVT